MIDDQIRNAHRLEYRNQRKAEMDAFLAVLDELEEFKKSHSQHDAWKDATEALEKSFKWDIREETVEEELEVKETVC